MSGVPIQLSGDTLYMSSTLIKVMLFIPWHPISLHWRRTLSHTDSQFLYTGYPQFYTNAFFWREQHWAMSNQHNWSFQLAIQCYKSNSIESMKECIIIWSSVSHIKPLWTFIPRILTYADLESRSFGVFARKEALALILKIFSDN